MGHINITRAGAGGLVAAIILFLAGGIIHGAILGGDWQAWQTAGHLPFAPSPIAGVAIWVLVSLINGLLGLAIYVGIRPRFGAGPKTAAIAGLILWGASSLAPALGQVALGSTPIKIVTVGCVGFLIATLAAVMAGGAVYQEP